MEAIQQWEPPPTDTAVVAKAAEVAQQQAEWEHSNQFDPERVNMDLAVRSLNLKLWSPPTVTESNSSSVCLLEASAGKSRVSIDYKSNLVDGKHRVSLHINNMYVGFATETTFKGAKNAVSDNCLAFLRKRGVATLKEVQVDECNLDVVGREVLEGSGNGPIIQQAEKIDEDNIGCKLMKAMGWKSDTGLGKDGQGMKDPILASGQLNRGGIGSYSAEVGISKLTVRDRILEFLRDSDKLVMEFSSDLSSCERKMVHTLAGKYGLKHKSSGGKSNRTLRVWKDVERQRMLAKRHGTTEDDGLVGFNEDEEEEQVRCRIGMVFVCLFVC